MSGASSTSELLWTIHSRDWKTARWAANRSPPKVQDQARVQVTKENTREVIQPSFINYTNAKSMADTWFIRAHETQHRSSICTWVRVLVLSTPTLLETVDWNDFLPKISCQWKVCSQCSADIHNQRWHHSPSVSDRTLSKPGGNLTQCSSLEDTTLQVAQPWSSIELHGNKVRAAWNF